MNGTNLFRLIVTLLVTAWAVAELIPPTSTPFEAYILKQVSAAEDEQGVIEMTPEENREECLGLVERANEKVKEADGHATST